MHFLITSVQLTALYGEKMNCSTTNKPMRTGCSFLKPNARYITSYLNSAPNTRNRRNRFTLNNKKNMLQQIIY